MINCPRPGNVNITITGTYFGQGVPRVIIGGLTCTNVVQDPVNPQTRILCLLPSGIDLSQAVLLIQNLGEYSLTLLTVGSLVSKVADSSRYLAPVRFRTRSANQGRQRQMVS